MFYIFIQVLSSQRQGQKQSLYVWICLKKEDHVILTANCTCVAGCIFVFLSFTLLHFILKKNKHLTYKIQRIHNFNWTCKTHSGQNLNILCTFTIGHTSTKNSLIFSNFLQRLSHNILCITHSKVRWVYNCKVYILCYNKEN